MSSLAALPTDGFHDRVVIRKAAEKFNVSVKDGINHLVQNKIIPNDSPAEVARVFHSIQGLSKRKIGEFLGKPADYNQKVLSIWLSGLQLSGLDIDQGIRHMILKMRLPGEAQQIDRMIEKFAREFITQNPDFDGTVDLVYVLSFSIIMLNTDLHNPSIPRKMSCSDFIYNNRGIDNNKDIPPEILTRIYHRIKSEPIRMDEDDMFESEVSTFVAPLKSGWLWKRSGGQISSYKKYWFVVTDGCLYYFVTRQDRNPRAIIPLEQCRVTGSRSRPDLIILSRDDGQYLKVMKTTQSGMRLSQHRQLIFRSLQQERSEWIASFQEAIRSLLSDEMNLVDGVSDGVNGGVPKYEDPATGDSIQYSDVRSPNTGGSLEDMESSRERAPTIVMMKEYNDGPDSFNSDEGGGSIPISRAQSKSTSRNYDSDSEANDDIVGVSSTSHAQFLSRPSSTGRGGSPLGEAHLLQGRVSISRARGLGDTELILLNRISQNVTKSNLKSTVSMSQGAVVGSESLEGLKKLLSVCAHVKESLASSSAVPPLSRGLNNHADAVDTSNVVNETVAESTDKLDFKGSAEAAQWAKGVDRLLKKYEKQRSYNIEVLMKLQALERSVYVVCRICTDTTEEVEAVCEVYGDRELGLLGADGEWKSYRFDKVWGIDVPQSQVFKDVEVLLSSVVDGHCACLIGVGDNVSAHRSTSVFGTTNEQGELQPGLAFHSASALWNNMQKTEDSNVIYVFLGEILQNGELVDLLNDVDGGEIDESETSGGIHMTKVKMTSPEQLKEIFKYVLTRRCDGNLVLCFDLFGSDGRLVVVDQGLDDGATVSDGNTANMGAMMQSVSAAVMQLGSFEGDAEPLRTVLGEQSVALAMYCVGNQEASLAATDKYLLHSASMQNKLQTATGQTIVEGQVVQLHMRALKTRIASARQSVESLHADAEHLLFELKKLKEDKSIDIGILNAYEQEVATARRSMDTQVSLLVSGLDQMTDYLREEASARDRHIARLDVIEKEVEALVSSGSDDPTSLKSALVESQTSVEGLLREMHVSIISKILTHNKREKDSFKERKERLSMLEKKQSLKEKPPSLKETSASVKEKSHDNQSQEKMSSGSKRTGGSKI